MLLRQAIILLARATRNSNDEKNYILIKLKYIFINIRNIFVYFFNIEANDKSF